MSPARQTIALISGSNQGIGKAVATRLAKEHRYHVIIGSRNAEAGEAVANDLKAEGCSASSVQLDVTSDASIAAATQYIEREFGVLDVLINNAGISIDYVPGVSAEKHKGRPIRALFQETLSTNVIGVACLTEACVPLLRQSPSPRLVFVSSLMGSIEKALDKTTNFYAYDFKAYDTSKAALNMLAVNYARILEADGAMVNAVCPGLVTTNLTNFTPYGTSTEDGATQIVQLATAEKGGPTGTFSDKHGSVPW